MTTIRAKVIPEPAEGTRPVLIRQNQDGPLIQDEGDLTYLCGLCGFALLKDVEKSHVFIDIVFKCPCCDLFNEISSTGE
ncbi:MAG: hypothetical protein JSW71_11620 [Gemmatimonadota bacterium]|nr:MAG: hypothetical protein JSW71_11620 [Gemmatimonadota bacterium]